MQFQKFRADGVESKVGFNQTKSKKIKPGKKGKTQKLSLIPKPLNNTAQTRTAEQDTQNDEMCGQDAD